MTWASLLLQDARRELAAITQRLDGPDAAAPSGAFAALNMGAGPSAQATNQVSTPAPGRPVNPETYRGAAAAPGIGTCRPIGVSNWRLVMNIMQPNFPGLTETSHHRLSNSVQNIIGLRLESF